jgi:hypothetical protein
MKLNVTITVAGLTLTALFALSALAAVAAKPEATGKPNGDQILKEMCATLAGARQFSFKAHREMDAALVPGSEVAQSADVEVTVQRPNKVMATSETEKGERRLYFDGKTFSLLDAEMNFYTTIPMDTSIDGLVDQIDKKYGFVPPLAEFAVSDPYKEFRREASAVSYVGRSTCPTGSEGMECEQLSLTGKEADAEVWIGVNDHLLKKLVATFHREGNPQLHITFTSWNLAASVTDSEFTFTPPKGAQKIQMRSIAEK